MRFATWGRRAVPFLLLFSGAAFAHGARSDVRVELLPVGIEGLIVELHQDFIAPQLVVGNRTGKRLEILDDEGRPFLRIGPEVAEGDLAAEMFHRGLMTGGAPPPPGMLYKIPRWQQVNREPSFGWLDPRIATEFLEIPLAVRQIGEELPFDEWRIPARLGGKALEFRGVFVYVPPPPGVVRAVLLSPAKPLPDLTVSLSPGRVPALFLRNDGESTVAVLDDRGQAFLKFAPDGVFADTGSDAWRLTGEVRGVAAGKGWRKVSTGRGYTWLEPRAAYAKEPPEQVVKAREAARLSTWSVPLLVGSQRIVIEGTVEWQPLQRAPAGKRASESQNR